MLNHDQYLAIEKFASDLKGCYEERRKEILTKESLIDKTTVVTLNYVINILDLHLQLAELYFEKYASDQEKTLDK